VLRLIAQGMTTGDRPALFLSEGTVKNYVSAIFAKLEVLTAPSDHLCLAQRLAKL